MPGDERQGAAPMRRSSWRARIGLRTFFITLATLIVFASGKLWPPYGALIWTAFLGAMAFYLYVLLREPVNYKSLRISSDTIDYVGLGGRDIIRLDEIARLEFVREQALFDDLHGPYLETKWLIQTASNARIEIMDEWPHRRQLLRTFRKRLPDFDMEAARKGLRARAGGRWLCFQAARRRPS